MAVTVAVLGFGVLVTGGVLAFGWHKLKAIWNNGVCVFFPQGNQESCREMANSKAIGAAYADFLERRNEFFYGLCQAVVVLAIIIVVTVLLLNEKISREAAAPILAGLGSFVIGKSVSAVKTRIDHDKPSSDEHITG